VINEIQQGRYNAVLHKLLDMKEGAPSPTLATDIFPMIALESDRPEWAFLGGENLCAGTRTDAAVAGSVSHVGLSNPRGSGVVVVITKIIVIGASGNGYNLCMQRGTQSDAAGYGVKLDTRAWPSATLWTPVAPLFDYTNATAIGALFGFLRIGPELQRECALNVVLNPGSRMIVRQSAVNAASQCTFFWRERALSPSETR
jgi:hypothetical protein